MPKQAIVTPKPVVLTIEQLQAMSWTCVSHSVDTVECDQETVIVGIEYDEEGNEVDVEREYFNRYAYGTATMRAGENPAVEISFTWEAGHEEKHSYEDSFDFDLCVHADSEIKLTGCNLVDEDGDAVEGWELGHALTEIAAGCEWEAMVRADLPIPETEVLETATEGQDITVWRDNAPEIAFKGACIGGASSRSQYNDNGRWTDLYLYQTVGGKFVCYERNNSQWQGERTKHKAEVCTNHAEVVAWFGQGRVAKELYADAGISNVQVID
jgi:hypothetical protein